MNFIAVIQFIIKNLSSIIQIVKMIMDLLKDFNPADKADVKCALDECKTDPEQHQKLRDHLKELMEKLRS